MMSVGTSSPGASVAEPPLVRLNGVRKEYGPVVALGGVDLDIRAGEVHCLAGENGAGKSTLIRVLTGAAVRDAGEYEISGRSMPVDFNPAEGRAAGVGVVYQELSLLPELNVMDNLLMGRFPNRYGLVTRIGQRKAASAMLDQVGLAGLTLETAVSQLPTATKQLIEIARVVGDQTKLVIFDEPTTALSDIEAAALLDRIRELRNAGTAVLYVTHRLEEMFEIGDRVTILRDGLSVGTRELTELNESSLIAVMVGREVTNLYPGERPIPGQIRLDVRGLRPQGFTESVDLTVRAGEIVGLAGLLGAGRSEILRAIFGAEPAEAGAVLVDGSRVSIRSPRSALASGIALLTKDRKDSGLLLNLSIRENVTLASLPELARSGVISTARQQAKATESVQGLRLKFGSWDDPVTSLSGGNQQKVLLGRWLGTEAKVLLLDELTKGVDIGAKADLYQVIADFAGRGLAVVIVSSYLPELLGLCDRIVVVREQAVAGELDAAEATEHRILELASPRKTHADIAALSHEQEDQQS